MRRGCVACSKEHPIESFKDEDIDFIETFLTHVPFCNFHTEKLEAIIHEKETKDSC